MQNLRRYATKLLAVLPFALSIAAKGYGVDAVAYEIRRSSTADYQDSELIAITTDTSFADTSANESGETYTYFVRAAWGQRREIRYFGGNIPAILFSPYTSSESVPDLVYYVQASNLSLTFHLLDLDGEEDSFLVWPEDDNFQVESLHNLGPYGLLLVRFVIDNRIYNADPDQTAELIAYDPFSETLIADLGSVGKSDAVAWSASVSASSAAQAVELAWNPFTAFRRNSEIVSIDHVRDIPPPTPPTIASVSADLPNRIRLVWEESSTAVSYSVYRSNTDSFAAATEVDSEIELTYYDDETVEPGQTYYYWVTSVNATGESEPSEPESATATADVYPLSVQSEFGDVDITPLKDYYAQGDSVTLTVSPDPGYAFDSWTVGSQTYDSKSIEIAVEGKTTATASFSLDVPQAYSDWAARLTPATSLYVIGPDRDLDGDGLVNSVEFALGTDDAESPDAPDHHRLETQVGEDATFLINANPEQKRERVWISHSNDLVAWERLELVFHDGAWSLLGDSEGQVSLSATPHESLEGLWQLRFTLHVQQKDPPRLFVRIGANLE